MMLLANIRQLIALDWYVLGRSDYKLQVQYGNVQSALSCGVLIHAFSRSLFLSYAHTTDRVSGTTLVRCISRHISDAHFYYLSVFAHTK